MERGIIILKINNMVSRMHTMGETPMADSRYNNSGSASVVVASAMMAVGLQSCLCFLGK